MLTEALLLLKLPRGDKRLERGEIMVGCYRSASAVACRRLLLALAFMVVILWVSAEAAGTKKKKKMKDIDWDALEKEWEKGDSPEELISDRDLKMKRMEEARKAQPKFDPK